MCGPKCPDLQKEDWGSGPQISDNEQGTLPGGSVKEEQFTAGI